MEKFRACYLGDDLNTLTLPRVLPDRVLDHVCLRLFGMPTGFGCEPATSNSGRRRADMKRRREGI